MTISPTITVKAKKVYIAFVNNRNFVYLHTKRSRLEMHLSLKKGELNDPKNVAIDISHRHRHHSIANYAVIVDYKSDLGYVLSLIAQAYDKTTLLSK
ncbi:MAG: DUF5655 domain-containing protein [Nitrososphaerota archaeon]